MTIVVGRVRGSPYVYEQRREGGGAVTRYIGPLEAIVKRYLEGMWGRQDLNLGHEGPSLAVYQASLRPQLLVLRAVFLAFPHRPRPLQSLRGERLN